MTACDTKERAISQLEKFSKELYLESANYTEADWQKAEVRFQQINDKITKHSPEYTEAEKKYIAKTQLECKAYFAKNELGSFWNELREGIQEGIDEILGTKETDVDTEL
jgi:hypothetical protein